MSDLLWQLEREQQQGWNITPPPPDTRRHELLAEYVGALVDATRGAFVLDGGTVRVYGRKIRRHYRRAW